MPKKEKSKLRVIPLGGIGEIGKNLSVIEYGEDIIIVDCGLAFPDDDMLGVDLVIPDVSYLEENEGVKTYTDIEISEKRVIVKRHGGILSEFIFEEGVEHSSIYSIPPYSFDAQIVTRKIRNNISFEGGTLTVFYNMTVGRDARSVRMKIEIL